jgi:hypothetical protein
VASSSDRQIPRRPGGRHGRGGRRQVEREGQP